MSEVTKIHWCDSSVNPVMGCSGCELWSPERHSCYAGAMHRQRKTNPGFTPDFNHPKLFPGRMAKAARWSDLTGMAHPDKPWLKGLPRMIFISDMGDALSERGVIGPDDKPVRGGAVPFDFLKEEIIDTVLSDAGRRHIWLWLTKRQEDGGIWPVAERAIQLGLPSEPVGRNVRDDAGHFRRIGHLQAVGDKHTMRFLSVEPLLEEISLAKNLKGIHWVLVGSESGNSATEFHVEWARRLRDECANAKVAFFLKQLGTHPFDGDEPMSLKNFHGGDWLEWPKDLRIRQTPS